MGGGGEEQQKKGNPWRGENGGCGRGAKLPPAEQTEAETNEKTASPKKPSQHFSFLSFPFPKIILVFFCFACVSLKDPKEGHRHGKTRKNKELKKRETKKGTGREKEKIPKEKKEKLKGKNVDHEVRNVDHKV